MVRILPKCKELETKLNQAKTTLKQFENSLHSVGQSGSQAADGMEQLGKKLDLHNMMEATQMLQGVSQQLIELGKATVGIAIDFDRSQRKIQSSLGLTQKVLKTWVRFQRKCGKGIW